MDAKLLQAIESIVKSDFPSANIISVSATEDEDSEGDRVLKITVVFESETGLLDPKSAAGIVRRVRPKLRERNVEAFPIFSFMTKADAELAGATEELAEGWIQFAEDSAERVEEETRRNRAVEDAARKARRKKAEPLYRGNFSSACDAARTRVRYAAS